jgi:RNA polymerase sigma-70 factor, ECF subfamily
MPAQGRRDASSELSPRPGLRAAPGSERSHPTGAVASGRATEPPLVTALAGGEIGLVERARAGDAEAFDALVALRIMPTFRLARAILGRTDEAEDATQEAFIAAWRGLPSLREPARFDAWFGRIAVNACRMSMRRRPSTVVLSLETVPPRQSESADDPWLSRVVNSDALHRAIDGLPVPQRVILALYYLEDRPMSSVAMILGIPSGTAKWRLWKARTALRTAMAATGGRPSAVAPEPGKRLGPASHSCR